MDDKRKQILVDYISYLYTTGRSYDSIGKYIKYVTDFLENSEEIKSSLVIININIKMLMLWCAIRLCVRLFVIYCLILKSDMADGKRL